MKAAAPHPLLGKWRIVEADLWDRDYLDMSGPAFIEFKQDERGEICFGCVTATFEYSFSPSTASFDWHGFDEMDEVKGDGFAELNADGALEIEFSFHNGDEANFKARKS
jgi:hypothetical protein